MKDVVPALQDPKASFSYPSSIHPSIIHISIYPFIPSMPKGMLSTRN